MINYSDYLPKMMTGKELTNALLYKPNYSDSVRNKSSSERLIALSTLYDVFYPFKMGGEIYSRLYLSILRSLNKKTGTTAIRQKYLNHNAIIKKPSGGIIGGSDSFTIIGDSGIGKSCAINRAVSLITHNKLITVEKPFSVIAPVISIQTPSDCSIKGLLYEILRGVDNRLGTEYYRKAIQYRSTTDVLIGSVSNVCLNSVGLLIIDEIENVKHKNGELLMGTLINLINSSGISIAMVGTPETKDYFKSSTFQMARRSIGLEYTPLTLDEEFYCFCSTLFEYQFLKEYSNLTEEIVYWLFTHSNGITSVVVNLLHDAQEISIIDGYEKLDINMLERAFNKRLSLLNKFILTDTIKTTYIKTNIKKTINEKKEENNEYLNLLSKAKYEVKTTGYDIVDILRKDICIEEVEI